MSKIIRGPSNTSFNRRDFIKKTARRSAVFGGLLAAGHLPYEKPGVKSFFGTSKAYAAATGPGKLSLCGSKSQYISTLSRMITKGQARMFFGTPLFFWLVILFAAFFTALALKIILFGSRASSQTQNRDEDSGLDIIGQPGLFPVSEILFLPGMLAPVSSNPSPHRFFSS